jgi:hypothetical protein
MSVKVKTFLDGGGKASDFTLTPTGLFETVKKTFHEKFGKPLTFTYKMTDGTIICVTDDKSLDTAHQDMLKSAAAFLRLEGSTESCQPAPAQTKPTTAAQTKPTATATTAPTAAPQKFCTECGKKLSGGKFCTECGHPIGAPAPQPVKEAPKSTAPAPAKQPIKEQPAKPVSQPEQAKDKPKETDHKVVEPIQIQGEVICAGCEKPVVSGVKVLEKYWHTYCFKCKKCGTAIGKGKTYEHDGYPYCEQCFGTEHAPKCNKCARPIIGDYVTVKGADYHDTCFVCTECKDKILSSYSMDQKGNILCTKCANKKRG